MPKKKEEKQKEVVAEPVVSGPFRSKCIVEEDGRIRTFIVTSEPILTSAGMKLQDSVQPSAITESGNGNPIYHPFEGIVQVVDVLVHKGDSVKEGQTVAFVEAMKAQHHIKSKLRGL